MGRLEGRAKHTLELQTWGCAHSHSRLSAGHHLDHFLNTPLESFSEWKQTVDHGQRLESFVLKRTTDQEPLCGRRQNGMLFPITCVVRCVGFYTVAASPFTRQARGLLCIMCAAR